VCVGCSHSLPGSNVTVIGHGHGITYSRNLQFLGVNTSFQAKRAAVVGFYRTVTGCDLARRGVRRGTAVCGYSGRPRAMSGSRRGRWRLIRSVRRRSDVLVLRCRKAVDGARASTRKQPATSRHSARRRLQLRDRLLRDHDENRALQLRQHHAQRYTKLIRLATSVPKPRSIPLSGRKRQHWSGVRLLVCPVYHIIICMYVCNIY